jgi:lipoprotein-anchoring transpeptidase ErfK/SrfK
MRRAIFLTAMSLAGLVAARDAGAQTLYNQPGLQGAGRASGPAGGSSVGQAGYGGGLIEMLMTGRDPGPGLRPQRGNYGAMSAADPNRGGRRYAGRPGDPAGELAQPALDPAFQKQVVAYDGREAPGTIVVDTPSKFLYLVQGNGQALRYGIGVGRPGFAWAGVKTVSAKKEWPGWTPPDEMLKRRPDLPRHMEGGPANPLGARALYLGSSLYRIHGTNEPDTIGRNVSSGCIRMMNEDVTDLYERVPVGTRVIVI